MESPVLLREEKVKAVNFEKACDFKGAVKIYEAMLKQAPSDLQILTRLIINSRKIKDHKKELKYITALIKVHESFFTAKKKKSALIISISAKN